MRVVLKTDPLCRCLSIRFVFPVYLGFELLSVGWVSRTNTCIPHRIFLKKWSVWPEGASGGLRFELGPLQKATAALGQRQYFALAPSIDFI